MWTAEQEGLGNLEPHIFKGGPTEIQGTPTILLHFYDFIVG